MHLSKVIPQHVSRQDFTWIKRDFALMDHDYRAIRAKVGGGMERCDWCEYAFADGDMMALAGRPAGRNWMLCQTCAQMAARPAPEMGAAPEAPETTWVCSICGRSNFVTVTHCEQCEYSRMILRDGLDAPRDGYR